MFFPLQIEINSFAKLRIKYPYFPSYLYKVFFSSKITHLLQTKEKVANLKQATLNKHEDIKRESIKNLYFHPIM